VPDDPNIEKAPDHSANDRTYDNYAVYWPGRLADGTLRQPQRPSWRQEGVQRQWRMARYDHRTGEIEVARESANATGWLYHVADLHQNPVPQRAQAPSIRNERPSVCPHCEADWSACELRAIPHAADRLSEGARCCRTRSFVRSHLPVQRPASRGTAAEARAVLRLTADAAKLAGRREIPLARSLRQLGHAEWTQHEGRVAFEGSRGERCAPKEALARAFATGGKRAMAILASQQNPGWRQSFSVGGLHAAARRPHARPRRSGPV